MSIPAEPSLLQNEVQCQAGQVAHWIWWYNILWLDIADLSDHCPVILLQMLEVWLCQWPSLTGMEHCALHKTAVHHVHTATCLEREVAGRESW